ncbi:AraC family transcriptional regulator [Actinomadura namibiensis]|uniref:AraC family transcriptional regulator n=1 Tax=Actinomadura kijaniata TaxID=46161 RepID=UPI00160284F6|nr:AraC family transcriptional regulator [Actinomadura namibiensis]
MDVLSDVLATVRVGRPYAGRVRCRVPWGVRFPSDDSACCHVVLQGACRLVPPDGPPLTLGVGDVLFTAPGHGHVLADRSGSPLVDFGPARDGNSLISELDIPGQGAAADLLCVRYRLDRLRPHPLLAELPPVIHLPARLGRHSALRTTVELMGEELWRPCIGTDALLASLMDMLLLYVLRTWIDERSGDTATGLAAALTDPAIAVALQHLHHRPEHLWTINELAALSGTSRSTFAKRFTTVVGQPPLAYLTWWRTTTAARLLHRTDVSLQAVVERCGSNSKYAFADAFERE